MKTIKFHWTGEYRPPRKGEWFIDFNGYVIQTNKDLSYPRFILRREEVEVGENEDD